MKTRCKQHLAEAEINLTPLIDVCFTILIMFIVVAPLLEIERIELASGPPLDQQNSAHAVQEKSPITIHVYSDDTIAVNQKPIPMANLEEFLRMVKHKNPQAKPQVFHDRDAKFGTYQAIKNAVEAAGFSEMDVILKPK
jgi:biopolymer transport protein ExbD